MDKVFRRTVLLLTLVCAALPPVLAAPYPVGIVARYKLRDVARHRDLPLRVYYPKSTHPERFPVILFSHGAGFSNSDYDYLGRYWAQNGYVSIFPNHTESGRSILKHGGSLSDLRTLRKRLDASSSFALRPKDIAFLIDSLPQLETDLPMLRDRMDPTRVGVGGHSLGAFTALAVAGSTVYPAEVGKKNLGDTRPLAYLALSPLGSSQKIGPFHLDSWSPVTRPTFLATGTGDQGYHEAPSWRLEAFQGLRPGHKYLAVLGGACHRDFVDNPLDGTPPKTSLHRWLQKATTLFWDAYLKRDTGDQAMLKEQRWPDVKGVKVRTVAK